MPVQFRSKFVHLLLWSTFLLQSNALAQVSGGSESSTQVANSSPSESPVPPRDLNESRSPSPTANAEEIPPETPKASSDAPVSANHDAQQPLTEPPDLVTTTLGADPSPVENTTTPAPPLAQNSGGAPENERIEPPTKDASPQDGPGTILGGRDGKISYGGYGGIAFMATELSDRAALLVGGEGAFLVDHLFAFGLAGYALASRVPGMQFEDENESLTMFAYGGPQLRYNLVGTSAFTASFGAMIGAGAIGFLREIDQNEWEFYEEYSRGNVFFVIEPSIQGHMQLTNWMRVGLNLSYRAIAGVDVPGFDDKSLRAFAAGSHLQFGRF